MKPTAVNGIDQVSSSIKCCRRGVHALVSSEGERGSAAPSALGSGKLQSKATTKIWAEIPYYFIDKKTEIPYK
jgi:hypothetical protein